MPPPPLYLHPGSEEGHYEVKATHSEDEDEGAELALQQQVVSLTDKLPLCSVLDDRRESQRRARLDQFMEQKSTLGELRCEDDFEILKQLATGSKGVVQYVRYKQNSTIMAKKFIHLDVKLATRKQILMELNILHKCTSPYIVGFYGAFPSENGINICMEFMDGGCLDLVMNKIGRIPEEYSKRITYAVLQGLLYLRERHQIIHRDVKPSNILLNSLGEVKMCDSGVSGQLIESLANSFVGTKSYMAPERLQGDHYSTASDLWSVGLTLLEISLGLYPIPPPNQTELVQMLGQEVEASEAGFDDIHGSSLTIFELLGYIVNHEPPKLPRRAFPDEMVEFVDLCLKKDPSERATLSKLMNHAWLSGVDSEFSVDMAQWVTGIMEIDAP